jgi:carbamoyltransferase
MYLLGISAYYHDSSACLFKDSELLFACEEEKFTGIKHDSAFPSKVIEYIFKTYNISYNDINMVCYYEDLNDKYFRVKSNAKKHFLKNPLYSVSSIFNFYANRKRLKKDLSKFNGKIFYSKHHLSHQYYSFYTSDYNDAKCLSIDGVGEIDTIGLSNVIDNKFTYKSLAQYPHSLGLFYSAMTSFLGFKPNEGEYKVMGLASYGHHTAYINRLKKLIQYEHGKLTCNMKAFCWDRSNMIMYTAELLKILNLQPRDESDYISQKYKDLAYAVQRTYEDILFRIIADNDLKKSNLCLSGGSAYNGTANGKLKRVTKLNSLWIPAAPSDAGSAIGACLCYLNTIGKLTTKITKSPFLGPSYSYEEVIKKLNPNNVIYFNDDDLYDYIADKLHKGYVIGWFNDRCEFGARALGNRSILGSPLIRGMRNKINEVIKKREGFRPFAPMVIKEDQHLYFEIDEDVPYMNHVVKVKIKHAKKLTEITHVDYSARVQTVTHENNMYKLLLKFKEYSDYPVLLNTSFNIKDKTMVLTPNDAINTFYDTQMNLLVLGNYVISK